MADRFYAPDLDPTLPEYDLAGPEAHHLRTVCRAKRGDRIELFDGQGQAALAELIEVERRNAVCRIVELRPREPPEQGITLACAIPKGDRGSFLVEKLVELGVFRLIPLQTERSVTDPGEGKLTRWRRTVIEACKQSGRNWLMEIVDTQDWTAVVAAHAGAGWLLHPSGDRTLRAGDRPPPIAAIGPEGGWTDGELQLAREHDWLIVQVAGHTLRIETAALFIASMARAQPME